jgi:hypothetical protein
VEQGQECFVMPRTTISFVKEVTKDKCYTIAESYNFIYSVKSLHTRKILFTSEYLAYFDEITSRY